MFENHRLWWYLKFLLALKIKWFLKTVWEEGMLKAKHIAKKTMALFPIPLPPLVGSVSLASLSKCPHLEGRHFFSCGRSLRALFKSSSFPVSSCLHKYKWLTASVYLVQIYGLLRLTLREISDGYSFKQCGQVKDLRKGARDLWG